MSETSQGPGWWIASDGKWYPPELHPDVRAAAPAPAPAPGAGVAGGGGGGGGGAPGGPPAWGAPAAGAWVARRQAQPTAHWSAGGPATWGAPPVIAASPPASRKPLLVVAALLVAIAGIGVGLAVVLGGSPKSIGTPEGVAAAAVSDLQSGNLPALCSLALPPDQQRCRASTAFATLFKITTQNLAVGNVTQQGTEALAVVTGTVCLEPGAQGGGVTVPPQCQSNTDRDVALDRGQTFAQAYARATQAGATGESFTFALVQSGGQWYLATP